MSQPIRPDTPDAPPVLNGIQQHLRRQGRVFGFRYDLDIRSTTLSDPDEEIRRPPLLPEKRPLALPLPVEPREATQAPAPEGIGRWESEGGK